MDISNNTRTATVGQSEPSQSIVAQDRVMQTDDNTLSNHTASQQATNSSPTANAREATPPKPPDRKELEALTEERLMENPEYVALKDKLAKCAGLEDMLLLIDTIGIANDRVICFDDIMALVNDTNQPNKAAREAAKFLNDNKGIWAAIAKNDNVASLQDVKDFIAGMKAEVKAMKETARAEINAENGVTPPAHAAAGAPAPAAGAANAATAAQTPEQAQAAANARAVMEEAGQALPKPPGSEFSGLEGATENLGNMIGWAEAEMDRLTTLMGKTDDPAALKQLELKINQMSRRMQQMTALMSQLTTAMQNISKMYSDIAMNSVRNIK